MQCSPFRLAVLSLALAIGSSACGTSSGAPSDAGVAIDAAPPAVCPEGHWLGDFSGKPLVELSFGEDEPYTFVYDTGAPTSLMDDATRAAVGDGPWTVGIGGRTVEVPSMAAVDLAAYGLEGIDGLVGTDVLGRFAVTLDFSRGRFWLDDARDEAALLACPHVDGDPAEVEYVRADHLFVPGRIEDAEGWLLVDSGASLGATTDPVFDELVARHPRPALHGFYTPAAVGTFFARLASVGSIEVGGRRVEHLATRTIPDGLLPAPVFADGKPLLGVLPSGHLHHFLFTVDYPAARVRLDTYRGIAAREPSRFFTVGISLESSADVPARVAAVLEGSAAAEAGVLPGDRVLRVDGTDLSTLTPYQRPWSLLSPTVGTPVQVALERDGTERIVTLETRDLLADP